MMRRTHARAALAGAVAVLLLLPGIAVHAQPTPPGGAGVRAFDRPVEPTPEARRPAALDLPSRRRVATAQTDDKREAQIITLQELIEMMDDANPEKPDLLARMADLYWEKAESFENKANDTALERRIFDAEAEGDETTAARYRLERDSYLERQKTWQERAVTMYQTIEERYPTYPQMDLVLFDLAKNLELLDRYDEAIAYYVKLASEYPESEYLGDALFAIGDYYFERNEFDNAQVFFEKVLNFPESPIYGYAMFKQAWCFYNLGDYDAAFQGFLAVVRHADDATARGQESPIALRREALKDLVLAYSHVGTPAKALSFFQTVDPANYLDMGTELAELYADQGKFEESNRLLQTIIAADPESYRVLRHQRIILFNADKRGKKEETAIEAERLIGLYQRVAPTAPADFLQPERARVEELLRSLATAYHSEYEKLKQTAALTLSRRLYGVYVELFPESQYAYVMHRNYGVLLYQQQEYERAVVQFERVLEIDPKGEFTEEAAYSALLSYYKLITVAAADSKSPDATDLSPAEIPDMHLKMVRACDRYVELTQGESPDVPDARFTAAKIYYDFNHFKEAAARFRVIIEAHEHHGTARDAARLLLSSFHLLRDIRNLNRWAEILSAKPHLASGELAVIIRNIRDRAEFNTCFVFEQDRRHRRAADCLVEYVTKFPTTDLMDKALFNAALNYEKANMVERAIEVFVDLHNRLPNSPLARRALFAAGKVYHHAAVYSEAARFYEYYVQQYPKDEFAAEALRFASLFRKSLGDYDQAIANLARFLQLFPKHERAAHIFFDIGVIQERKRDWKAVIDHFKEYIAKYGKRGPLDLRLIAGLKIAQALGRYKGEAQQRRATQAYQDLVEFFNALKPEQIATLTPPGVSAVAEARFILGEQVLARAIDIRITQRSLAEATAEKMQVLAEAKAIFEDVYNFDHPHWQIAALNRVGVSYADLADAVETSPCPRELSKEICEEYRLELAVKADAIRATAIEFFRKCLETAREAQWFNRYSDEAEQQLAQLDNSYRFTSEYRARPVYTRTYAYPSAFFFIDAEAEEKKAP